MEQSTTLQIISLVLNFILGSGLVGTLLFFKPKKRKETAEAKGEELKNTEQIVTLQSQQIKRLDGRVETLEKKVEAPKVEAAKADTAKAVDGAKTKATHAHKHAGEAAKQAAESKPTETVPTK